MLIRDCLTIYFTVMISQNLGALDPYLCEENRVKKYSFLHEMFKIIIDIPTFVCHACFKTLRPVKVAHVISEANRRYDIVFRLKN